MSDVLERAQQAVEELITTPWYYTPPGPDGTIHKVSYVTNHHEVAYTRDLLSMADTGHSEASSWDQRRITAQFIANAPELVLELVEALAEARSEAEKHRDIQAQLRSANNRSTYERLLKSNAFGWE